MSSLMIRDLARTRELDRRAMAAVVGGTGSSVPGMPSIPGAGGLGVLGSLNVIANVNVSVNQNLTQMQYVNVAALNNVGSIGSYVPPLHLDVSPTLMAGNYAAV